jgi:hypothetical protein
MSVAPRKTSIATWSKPLVSRTVVVGLVLLAMACDWYRTFTFR